MRLIKIGDEWIDAERIVALRPALPVAGYKPGTLIYVSGLSVQHEVMHVPMEIDQVTQILAREVRRD